MHEELMLVISFTFQFMFVALRQLGCARLPGMHHEVPPSPPPSPAGVVISIEAMSQHSFTLARARQHRTRTPQSHRAVEQSPWASSMSVPRCMQVELPSETVVRGMSSLPACLPAPSSCAWMSCPLSWSTPARHPSYAAPVPRVDSAMCVSMHTCSMSCDWAYVPFVCVCVCGALD